jgi:pimeloyl-ACP methyl ester carboxylesterase
MSIYGSTAGQAAIRAWCTAQLDGWGLPHQRREVMTLAGPTHLVEAGSGTPVVVVPGTNFGAASMLALIGPLSREYRVIAPDLPGQPGLSGDTRHHDAAAFDGWLSAVVESTGIESPLVIGHSLGGMVSLAGVAGGAGYEGCSSSTRQASCGCASRPA